MSPQEVQESQLMEMKTKQVACIAVAEAADEFERILQLAEPDLATIIPFVGIHPINPTTRKPVDEKVCSEETLRLMKSLLVDKRAFGIGEIGLDYSPHFYAFCNGNKEMIAQAKNGQLAVFTKQLLLAVELDCFVNVHSRQSGHYAIDICLDVGVTKAIFHAFDGKIKYALDAVGKQRRYFFSIAASVVRDPLLQQLAIRLPLQNLLVESDAPALPAVKDGCSKPTDVIETIAFIAHLRGICRIELEKMIWENSLIVLDSNDRLKV